MSLRSLSRGLAAALVLGSVYVYLSEKPSITLTPPLPPEDVAIEEPPKTITPGWVVADDETSNSPPRQTIAVNSIGGRVPYAPMQPVDHEPERPTRTVVINNKEYPVRTYEPLLAPNDPSADQWWVSSAELEHAWDIPRGEQETVLAIIDTGFALAHEEFTDRWYANAGESGAASSEAPSSLNCSDRSLSLNASCNLIDDNGDGIVDNESGAVLYENPSRLNCTDQSRPLTRDCNRIDDDDNGLVDDARGWDFINYDDSVQAGELNPNGLGTEHGTMVAGVAAATGNNSKGIAGVDWATKILPIQAIDDDEYGDTLSVGRAIFYAADQGADVISLSLGSDLPDDYVQEAVQYAIARGSVVVAASGNDGCECMVFPARYDEVVSVGAHGAGNTPAYFSSWGSTLDILAPGVDMDTATWLPANGTDAYVDGVNGTSFATPVVSGLMTRLLSQQPDATPLQLIAAVTDNTNRLSLGSTTTRSKTLGFGKVDAYASTERMAVVRNYDHAYAYTTISRGHQLDPDQPSEVAGEFIVQDCDSIGFGTTPIYELSKSGKYIFTVSSAENWHAKSAGYSSKLFAYACLAQPHDTFSIIRNIQLFPEFKNMFSKEALAQE